MFDFGLGQMILLGTIALIAIGPKQLPEVAKTLGRFVGELKKYSGELTRQVIEAREATNYKLMVNQQNQQNANGQASGPTQGQTVGASTVAAGMANAPVNTHAHDPFFHFNDGYDHDPAQLSFEFKEFIDCYPMSFHSSNPSPLVKSEVAMSPQQ